jgi:exodeoxyribonuclease V alpha subunit
LEPALNPVTALLTDAAGAGHTVLPRDVVLRRCTQADADAAVADGAVVDVEWHGAPAWALTDVAESEELLADGLVALAEENRLAVVVGPDPAGRRVALARALAATTPSVVLDDAHLLGLDDVLAAVEDLAEDAVLVLALDNALPLAEVPGAVALDVASTGVCPVIVGDTERDARALGLARASVASGTWPSARADDRTFVAVAAASPEEAMLRVTQIVATSIPRAFGLGPADIAVLPWDTEGPVGASAVRSALAAAAAASGAPSAAGGATPGRSGDAPAASSGAGGATPGRSGDAPAASSGAGGATPGRSGDAPFGGATSSGPADPTSGAAAGGGSPSDGVAPVAVVPLREVGDRTWPATVVVLPGVVPPGLSRASVYAGLRTGIDHVSVVHGFGPEATALAELVATTSDRPRRTRLAALITEARTQD